MAIISLTRGRRQEIAQARIVCEKSLYSDEKVATVDFFGTRLGENGCTTFHGNAEEMARMLERLARRLRRKMK